MSSAWNISGGFIFERNRPIWTSWPTIESYLYNVEEYVKRTLTYAEDTLNAFAAIADVQMRTMKDTSFYGHPELCFTDTLWRTSRATWNNSCQSSRSRSLIQFPFLVPDKSDSRA